jgi:hypothetical protein
MNKGEKRTKPRPPKLELDKANKAGQGEGASSASSLRTPKEIAHDIAIQCVSPGIGPFTGGISEETRDAVMISKNVEAEQRKLIAERMGQDSTLTPKTATKMVEIEQINNGQLSPNNLARSGSLKRSMKRKEPPKRLELKQTSPLKYTGINSAPLARTMTDKSYINNINNASGGRSASNPVYAPGATQHTVYVRNRVKEDGAQSALPLRNNNWTGLQHHTRSRSDDPNKTTARQSDDEDDEDDDSDPEDKALSDQDKKQSATEKKQAPPTTTADYVELNAIDDEDELRSKRRKVNDNNDDKKQRFLHLCSELWDLLKS